MVDPGMGIRRMLACYRRRRPQAFIGIPRGARLRALPAGSSRRSAPAITVGRRWFWRGPTLNGDPQRRPGTVRGRAHRPGRAGGHPLHQRQHRAAPRAWSTRTATSTPRSSDPLATLRIAPGEVDLPTFPLFALFDPALGMTAVIPDMDPTRPAQVDPQRIVEAIATTGVTNMFGSPALLDRGRPPTGREHGITLPVAASACISAGAPVPARTCSNSSRPARRRTPRSTRRTAPPRRCRSPRSRSSEILGETRRAHRRGRRHLRGPAGPEIAVRIIAISDEPHRRLARTTCVVAARGDRRDRGARAARQPRLLRPPRGRRPGQDPRPATGVWHRMGDLGCIDEKGRLWFCGRKSHRVVTAARDPVHHPVRGHLQHPPAGLPQRAGGRGAAAGSRCR